ncbi:MAG: hypothetical protein MJK12_15950, partial [Colwellia sp.]|nr:hypothetical protein [Colwellia sp.]
AELATVASVDAQGRVEQVKLLAANTPVTVSSQAKHITCAAVEDTVMVQNTRQGLIVIAQLAKPSDSPSAHITDNNGHVIVKGAKSVTLSTRKGSIEVYDDGRIVLEASQLSASSERDLCLDGWPIRLN